MAFDKKPPKKSNRTALLDLLRRQIDGEVHDDPVRREMHATDASIYRVTPLAVVYPKNRKDVVETVQYARKNGLTVHPRGTGSGTCGAALGRGLVLDFTRFMNRLVRIDMDNRTATCQPGYRGGELVAALSGTGLFFPPDPSSVEFASLGGMVSTNACGAHSVKYGNVVDSLVDAELVMSDGSVIRLSEIRKMSEDQLPGPLAAVHRLYNEHREKIEAAYPDVKSNSCGYHLSGLVTPGGMDLRNLLAGSEGTLGIITQLTLQLRKKPRHDALIIAFFPDITASTRAVQRILPTGPSGIEIMDHSVLKLASQNDPELEARIPPGVSNILLVEFDGDEEADCHQQAGSVQRLMVGMGAIEVHQAFSREEKDRFWSIRKATLPILYRMKGEEKAVAVIEDAVVPVDQLVSYYKGIYRLLNDRGIPFVLYGHISRGLLHVRPMFNLKRAGDIRQMAALTEAFFDLVRSHGGTISGEHGDGRLRSAFIRRQYPDISDVMLRVKTILDKDGVFNPDIKTNWDPARLTSDLRYGADYRRRGASAAILQWPEGFAEQAETCHGCAKCTTVTTATRMCPVYKFTRDEAATPRSKANILRTLISGALNREDLYRSAFQQVMNACILCGSCYAECPSHVNIPKLAMEAKARYTEKFGIPLRHRLSTSAEEIGRIAGKMPGALGRLNDFQFPRKIAARVTGIHAEESMVPVPGKIPFPSRSSVKHKGHPRLLYFSGCAGAYLQPEIGNAAVRVLAAMGMDVLLPPQHCCGLPMLTKGMTEQARGKIEQNLKRWGHLIDSVDHVVVTCSSCGLALQQEWKYLLKDRRVDVLGEKLIHISRLIQQYPERLSMYPLSNQAAAYHSPCHLRVQKDPESSADLLKKMPGLDLRILSSHCCGMAGTWGLYTENLSLSRDIGLDLIEKIKAARVDFAVTDCPTCRMQLERMGTLPVKHPVEIIEEAVFPKHTARRSGQTTTRS